jgi:hypothetical protein
METVATAPVVTTLRPAIAWPPASQVDGRALAALGAEAASRVARAPVPVLAPPDPLDAPTLVVGPEYYAISARARGEAGATIRVQGTRAAHRVEGLAPLVGDRAVRGVRGFVTVNEGIRSASWIEDGAAYVVDVECADPFRDPRCTDDTFVLDLAARLAFVGGARR